MKATTSEEAFRAACPCAKKIMRYVASLPELEGISRHFGGAVIRAADTTAVFVCAGLPGGAMDLRVSAALNGRGGWKLTHESSSIGAR